MAMKNYKVVQQDGTETYYQFDDPTDDGKGRSGSASAGGEGRRQPGEECVRGRPEAVQPAGEVGERTHRARAASDPWEAPPSP
jgi:hypothetical protein